MPEPDKQLVKQAPQSLQELLRAGPLPQVTGHSAPYQHSSQKRGKANTADMAHTGCKAGHSHWLPACLGFWERTFRPKVGRSFFTALPCIGRNGRHQDPLGPRPCMVGNQPPEAGSHTGIHALLGFSLWDVTTMCSRADGSWTASTLWP